jgi:dienelactone hydrolase
MSKSKHLPPVAWATILTAALAALLPAAATGQPLGRPDVGAPGDRMTQAYLGREAERLDAKFAQDLASLPAWEAARPRHVEEYFDMLGLSPQPDRTPLRATVIRTLARDGYAVEMVHFQSRPGLYVTGNLYRPAAAPAGERLPAVLYLCGHADVGRDGNKVAYQSHGIWFARHGYVCLVLDTLQLGEIAATHHGTYKLGRWWWQSRGYTPAGVEAWNGIRAIDYLIARPDVDAGRLAVTGISGGGAATIWVAAADDRVTVAVPVSGMADLTAYVGGRAVNGHCDCMFVPNAHRWPWTRLAGLVAPRPLLFVNSDQDPIFPMDANERVAARLERLYALHGAGDRVDAVVSVGGHAYRPDIRRAVFGFVNAHLKGDARPVTDAEVDLVGDRRDPASYPIPPAQLRVFPTDADLPKDQINTTVDERFVPLVRPEPPAPGGHDAWRRGLLGRLRATTFATLPDSVPAAVVLGGGEDAETERVGSEEGIEFRLRFAPPRASGRPTGVLLAVLNEAEAGQTPAWVGRVAAAGEAVVLCEPRGVGATRWTRKNPPNYVERSHALIGRTVDGGRLWDVVSAAAAVATHPRVAGGRSGGGTDGGGGGVVGGARLPVRVAGSGAAGVIAGYAAALDDRIAGAVLVSPPATHMAADAPQFLNVLRTCDVPDVLGLVAPRPLAVVGAHPPAFTATATAYDAAGAKERLTFE